MRSTLVLLGAAAALTVVAPAAAAQDPPSRIQICAATDIAAVDDLLSQISTEDLVTRLQPLAELTVPRDPDGVVLRESVDLTDVRQALNCDDGAEPDPTTDPTPTPTVEPTATPSPAPTTAPTLVPPAAGGGFSQLDQVPTGPAETGGGPA